MNKVVRVAVNNNFNCTKAEFQQLDELSKVHPDSLFFINTNIKTPKLLEINNHPYKAVITVNPDITIDRLRVGRLYHIASNLIAFTRIKYIPGKPEIVDLIKEISQTLNVVITLQRFNGKKSISQYVPDYREHYKFTHNRFRLTNESVTAMQELIGSNRRVSICDLAGTGCGGCGLCSTLTTSKSLPIYTLNMSSSGFCMYNCCDCYAKTIQRFLIAFNRNPIVFDKIYQNAKQKGITKHILHAKSNLR